MVRILYVLLMMLLSAGIANGNTLTIIATNDGFAQTLAAETYLAARDATAGTSKDLEEIHVGQKQDISAKYYNFRGFLSFTIPDLPSLSSATLMLHGYSDGSDTDFDLYVLSSTYSNPLVKEDFDLFDGHQVSGVYTGTILNNTWNTEGLSADWNTITFNAAGLAAILAAKNTTWKIALISSRDYNNTTPSGAEDIGLRSSGYWPGMEPYLSLTYSVVAGHEPYKFNSGTGGVHPPYRMR